MQKKKFQTKKKEKKSPVKDIKKIDTKAEKKIEKITAKMPEKVSKNKKSDSKNKVQEKIPKQKEQEIVITEIKEEKEQRVEVSDEGIKIDDTEESNIELEVPKTQKIEEEASEMETIEESNIEEAKENETDEEDSQIEHINLLPINDFQDEKNKVEALLFACGRYIEETELSELIGLEKKKIKKALEGLRKDYESQKNSLMIFQEENSWKINVREKYLPLVRKIVSETELGKSAMETLAVVAWKSPVYQNEVVKIRGNKCYDHIEDLENMGYITKDKKGRSYVLKTTEKFYTYFDIDRKNLQGVLDAAKKPEAKEIQVSLEQVEKPQEEKRSIVDAINVKKKTESEEEKLSQEEFLKKIEEKILIAKDKNEQFEEELPRQKLDEPQNVPSQEIQENPEQKEATEQTSNPNVSEENGNDNQQPITDAQKKPKSLTKKQLEKKFKEELLRVREKMEEKK